MDRVARRVEETFPQLRDDVTNSLLLFDQVEKDSRQAGYQRARYQKD